MTVSDECAESDHCPLTLGMMLQATAPPDVQHSDVNAPPSVTIDKIKYDSSKIEIHGEKLLTLLLPVFAAPAHQCCLASALQTCIAQAALESFRRPCKKSAQKVNQKILQANAQAQAPRMAARSSTGLVLPLGQNATATALYGMAAPKQSFR